ncbi:MAG: ATP-grasp domain-containing protein [Candidatus Woesearchaeota archaeon]
MYNTCIYFRKDPDNEQEFNELLNIAKELGYENNVFNYLLNVPENSLIFGRYSVLPFYKHIEEEFSLINSKLINSYDHHKYIADMHWYYDIENITPKSHFNAGWLNVPKYKNGWVVKGITNSRKFKWNTHMYASTIDDLKNVIERLYDDPLIKDQGIVIREYIPLEIYETGINGMKFTNEWRFFFFGSNIIDYGYYWSIIDDKNKIPDDIEPEGKKLALKSADIISKHTNFFVVDVAKTQEGNWIVIEINDGQMSGLSTIPPKRFYKNLLTLCF